MRDAAGELADGFHLLRLHERGFRALPLRDLARELFVRGGELARAVGDALLERRIEPAQLLLGAADAQKRAHGRDEFVGFDGLREIAVGTALEAARAVGAARKRGGRLQHHRARPQVLDAAADLDAADVGQFDVEDDDGRLQFLDLFQGLEAGAGFRDLETGPLQITGLRVARRLAVVHVQDDDAFRHAGVPVRVHHAGASRRAHA